jgi:O-succinylbenzoic acid--CoA ligase
VERTVDWTNKDAVTFISSRLGSVETHILKELSKEKPIMPAHVWLATSGSESGPKLVALSKPAILSSAEAVNQHLESTKKDVWLKVLPSFHIGGLAIHARAYLSGAKCVDRCGEKIYEWVPENFLLDLVRAKASLTSLVPTQVYDLVQAKLKCPSHLRAVIVGGGALALPLWKKAVSMGWPLLTSYGLTECSSQVATSSLTDLKREPHPLLLWNIEARIQNSRIELKSPALLSGYFLMTDKKPQFVDPKVDGWFATEDRGAIVDGELFVHGRISDMVKIKGELVDVEAIRRSFINLVPESEQNNYFLLAKPDERSGHQLVLYVKSNSKAIFEILVEKLNLSQAAFAQIKIVELTDLPRTALGKIVRSELQKL